MRKFSIRILEDLDIWYNHYLCNKFINKEKRNYPNYFKAGYPLLYCSRVFDKPAKKGRDGTYLWWLDNRWHRVGKPARICSDGSVEYFENGQMVRLRK